MGMMGMGMGMDDGMMGRLMVMNGGFTLCV